MNSIINIKCFHCRLETEIPFNVLSFRCDRCKKIQCMICSVSFSKISNYNQKKIFAILFQNSHGLACNFFGNSTGGTSNIGEGSETGRKSRRALSVYARPKTPLAIEHRRRKSMSEVKTVAAKATVHCDVCNQDYAALYFARHIRTKKHEKAAINFDFNANFNDSGSSFSLD